LTTGRPRPLVVVLGASGLLGSAIAGQLAARPVRLRLVGRRATPLPDQVRAEVEVRQADLTEPAAVAAAATDADAIVHLVAHTTGTGAWRSAEHDDTAERGNVGVLRDLIKAVAAQPRPQPPTVLFSGSVSQVGRPRSARLTEEEPDRPETVYDRHKLAAEHALLAATAAGIVRGASLRLGTLFGQGTVPNVVDRGVVATMMRRAFAGEPLTMWNDGSVRRDLLCVDDAAAAFVRALECAHALSGRHWLISSGRTVSIGELFTAIATTVADHTGRPPVPVRSVCPPAESIAADLVDFAPDPSAFIAATDWRARVPLRNALEQLATAMGDHSLYPGHG
jgi:nucleoside-diphosphate-sugar epimerase